MIRLLFGHARRRQTEQGFAMITALLVIMIVTALIAGSLSYSLGSLPISRHDQDWNAALSAAEAGVDDYIFRLNQNTNYWLYSSAVAPPDGNLAFSFAGGKPVFVPLPGIASDAKFHYSADTSTLPTDGIIKLTSTGVDRKVSRTVQMSLRQHSFLDFLYFTNYETTDPALYSNPPYSLNTTQAGYPAPQVAPNPAAGCTGYYPNRNALCQDLDFISADTINGPLDTNDVLRINGDPTFNGTVTTATTWAGEGAAVCPSNGNKHLWHDAGSSSPNFLTACDPVHGVHMTAPPSNLGLRALTDPAIGGAGCLFTGPTKIVLNATGTMTVTSPDTQVSNCPASSSPWPSAAAQTMALPSNGVIDVQNVPTLTTDPNYKASTAACTVHPLGYPLAAGDVTKYGCGDGDTFLSGVLNGQLTITADSDIFITGNVTYNGGLAAKDVLGLIATNNVAVYHPVKWNNDDPVNCPVWPATTPACAPGANATYTNLAGSLTNPIINAAMLSLTHTFLVSNFGGGNALGTLNVTGAIAQNFRGPVGRHSGNTVVNGYAKNYVYDQRLQYLTPPHFISPLASAWQIKLWAEELPPAFPAP